MALDSDSESPNQGQLFHTSFSNADGVMNDSVEATGILHAVMHWTKDSYERIIKKTHGLELYGWPENIEFQHPSLMASIGRLHELIRSWRAGHIGFRRVMEVPTGGKRKERGVREESGGRRKMRRVMTIGVKAKGKVKSPEIILDSDEELERDVKA